MSSHLSSIRAKCPILVHKHFYTQCKISNFKCFIIDTASKKMKLTMKEANYIKAFNTRYPNGLNIIANNSRPPTIILPFNSLSQKISSNIKNISLHNNIPLEIVYKNGRKLINCLK